MATPAQVIANQSNAQLSTGPRSTTGKLASSQNSTTTGLTSAKPFVRPEERQAFDEFHQALLDELQPQGVTQEHHFALILHAAWNLRRCLEIETEIMEDAFTKDADVHTDPELSRKLDRIYRYKKMHESSHRRASADLRQLQTGQLWRRGKEELQGESILLDTTKVQMKLTQHQAIKERGNLDILRQHIEACINSPLPYPRH